MVYRPSRRKGETSFPKMVPEPTAEKEWKLNIKIGELQEEGPGGPEIRRQHI